MQWAFSGGSLAVGANEEKTRRPWKPNYGAQLWGADAATASLVSTKAAAWANWERLVAQTGSTLFRRRSLGPVFNDLAPGQRSFRKTSTAASALGHSNGHGSWLGFDQMEPNRLMTCRPGLLA
ncbi:uncharacterized protein TrAFT101_009601 [Trichoderma asperellum]|uniref:uncharacterized protein n=1 Tax=Trichoderma asperellum TaxID=101201 RepID=UPI003330F22F|nr:hypothetical protein TrAFT101_009601 [Trichoderma asperellum]